MEEAQEPAQRQYSSRDRSLPRGAGILLEVQEPLGGGRGSPAPRCYTWQSSHAAAIKAFHASHFDVLFDVQD